MTKLPKTIFIKMEEDGDVTYPVPSEEMAELLDSSEVIKIGTYHLVETHEAQLVVSKKKIEK